MDPPPFIDQSAPPTSDSTASTTASTSAPASPTPPTARAPPFSDRAMSDSATVAGMTPSSTPLGNVNAARRPPLGSMGRGSAINNPDIAAKMRAFTMQRRGAPPPGRSAPGAPQTQSQGPSAVSQSGPGPVPTSPIPPSPGGLAASGGVPSNFQLPQGISRPMAPSMQSAPAIPGRAPPGRGLSLAEKRGLKLPGGLPGQAPPAPGPAATAGSGRRGPKMTLSDMRTSNGEPSESPTQAESRKEQSALDRYSEFIDKETGSLKFKGKAILNSQGVEFSSGQSFKISLDEVDTLDEMGKGNYGTVYKVRHARPQMRRPGQGLAGNKAMASRQEPTSSNPGRAEETLSSSRGAGTGIVMAMKEIRLELDDAKFAAIIMELDILHRCVSPFIVDFYGAFFQEGAVYICMEFMDGGSMDKLYGDGIPENVLRQITLATTRGLKSLKDEHNIIHRDVKPTNILVNSLGAVKICDFGVSGNLVASIAKTNIGCQSYMAPERISSGGVAQAGANPGGGTYSVQSDIWSLGLTIIECAMGRYPYPPETYDNIFSQLSAIVDGVPPDLPADSYSEAAHNFVAGCLNKIPKLRPTYAMLLQHVWLAPLIKPSTISEEDEDEADGIADAVSQLSVNDSSLADSDGQRWINKDVGQWMREQVQKKKDGVLGKHQKPALHAAPLNAVSSPGHEKPAKHKGVVTV